MSYPKPGVTLVPIVACKSSTALTEWFFLKLKLATSTTCKECIMFDRPKVLDYGSRYTAGLARHETPTKFGYTVTHLTKMGQTLPQNMAMKPSPILAMVPKRSVVNGRFNGFNPPITAGQITSNKSLTEQGSKGGTSNAKCGELKPTAELKVTRLFKKHYHVQQTWLSK